MYEQLKAEGKTSEEALQILSICSQINNLVNKQQNGSAKCSEGSPDNSLSVNTSDVDDVESEYYLDDGIEKKVTSMNKNFESRVKLMTKVIVDRIEESSSSDEYQNLMKVNAKAPYLSDHREGDLHQYSASSKRDYRQAFRTQHERANHSGHKRLKTEDDAEAFDALNPSQFFSSSNNPYYPQPIGADAQPHKKMIKRHSVKIKRKRKHIDLEKEARRINAKYNHLMYQSPKPPLYYSHKPAFREPLYQSVRVKTNEELEQMGHDGENMVSLRIHHRDTE